MGLSGLVSSSFGDKERTAFDITVGTICGTSTSDVNVTSVSNARRRLLTTASSSVVVAFQVRVRLSVVADKAAVVTASDALTKKLAQAVSSGNFTSKLSTTAAKQGSVVLSSVSVSSSLKNVGTTSVVVNTAEPTTAPTNVKATAPNPTKSGISTGVIVGIVVGVVGGVCCLIAVIIVVMKRDRKILATNSR